MSVRVIAVLLVGLGASVNGWSEEFNNAEWPEFRGPSGSGHSIAKGLPLHWSETSNVVWRSALPGRGWSSPVIEGNRIWLTTALESEPTDEQRVKAQTLDTGGQPITVTGKLTLGALGIDLGTGKLIMNRELMVEESPDPVHALNTFASPTPVIERGLLYCHFGANGTCCLDTRSGEIVWRQRDLRIKHENGAGSSPILWGDRLIFHCDGSDQQFVVGLDKRTGKVAWKTARSGKMDQNPQLKKAYGTPLVVTVDGRPVVLSPGADWLYAYDPENGRELWKVSYEAQGFSIVPRPVAGAGMVFFSTSFMQAELLAVKLDSKPPEIAWRYKNQAPQMPSPLLVGDELYFVSDKGIATCLDSKSGTMHWNKRLGGNFCSSPIFADGRIYVGNREGNTFVLKPGTSFELLATNHLDGSIMASPAAVGRAIYLRTDQAMYKVEQVTNRSN